MTQLHENKTRGKTRKDAMIYSTYIRAQRALGSLVRMSDNGTSWNRS